MPKFLLVLSLLSVTATGAAFAAEGQGQHSGTEEEQKACAKDVSKFCRPLMDQGDLVILSCLQQNRSKLTKACNDVLVSHGQ
jgi:hypothetical protein